MTVVVDGATTVGATQDGKTGICVTFLFSPGGQGGTGNVFSGITLKFKASGQFTILPTVKRTLAVNWNKMKSKKDKRMNLILLATTWILQIW